MMSSFERNVGYCALHAILAGAVVGGCSLLVALLGVSLVGSSEDNQVGHHRRLYFRQQNHAACRGLEGREYNKCLRGGIERKFTSDPKTVENRNADEPITIEAPTNRRKNCQVVYIMGVEGATHHGITPIIEALAMKQIDPESGRHYLADSRPIYLKAGLFGWFKSTQRRWGFSITPDIDDPLFVQRVVESSCPDDGNKHVLIEWASFPSGEEGDARSYRVHRQHAWLSMSPDEIANNEEAREQPLNITAFVEAYSPYVEIKFVVIHRPFIETIASHMKWDGGAPTHSNIIHGFLLILSRFLASHPYDLVTGERLWFLLCLEKVMSKNYKHEGDVQVARQHILSHLADFLGWPVKECNDCFDLWHESKKDPYEKLGGDLEIVLEHANRLVGVWPPPGDVGVAEQQCRV